MRHHNTISRALFSLLSGIGVLLGIHHAEASPKPDLIVHHAKIFTAEPCTPWAEAIAIKGGKVVAVGKNNQVLAMAHPKKTKVIHAQGRTIVPGINDAHVHVLATPGILVNYQSLDFIQQGAPGPGLAEVLGMVAGAAAVFPPGTWLTVLVGENVDQDDSATRFALDTVAPDHPVWLQMWTGHGTFVNSKALDVLDIDDDEPDPLGGEFERVPGTTILTGKAHEYAEHLLRRKLLATVPDAVLAEHYKEFATAALSRGVTSIQDIPVGLTKARALGVLEAADLPIRVRSVCFPLSGFESCDGQPSQSKKHMISSSGVKWITDGTPVERRAFLNEPYADAPGHHGHVNFDDETLEAFLLPGLHGPAKHRQRLFHAVGDGAIDRVLDAVDATGGGHKWRKRRLRIEHGDLIFPENYDRLRNAGAVIVQNPTHFGIPQILAQRFVGPVMSDVQPLATLLQEGIPVALGSDSFGAPPNPWLDVFLATVHPTRPEEAISVAQAITAYTRTAAYAEFEDDKKGRLAPGYEADFAMLSADPFTIPPWQMPNIESVLTVVDGEIRWNPAHL